MIRFLFLIFFLIAPTSTDLLTLHAQNLQVQEPDSINSTAKQNVQPFSLSQYQLHRLGDYDLAKWCIHMPHIWLSRASQTGQPYIYQGIGSPTWMSSITWNGIQLVDPVYGLFDLNLLSAITIDTISSNNDRLFDTWNSLATINIVNEKTTSSQPYSQVFYNAGGNDFSMVDILFRRGFSREIRFKAGANFHKFGGIFFNSKVDNFNYFSEIAIPFSNKLDFTYFLLSNRIEAGYPGAIADNYVVQFQRLHRKVIRQDHAIMLDYDHSEQYKGTLKMDLHVDEREYTDWQLPWHSIEKMRWASIAAQLRKITPFSTTGLQVSAQAISSSRIGSAKISEYPLRLSFIHHQKTILNNEFIVKSGFEFYNSDWQGYNGEIKTQTSVSTRFQVTSSGFYKQQVPPFGWRHGRILPFENQVWPVIFSETGTSFLTESRPQKPVITSGIRFRLHWQPSDKFDCYADLLFHQMRHHVFPKTDPEQHLTFFTLNRFYTTGMFLQTQYLFTDWLSVSGRYQYSSSSSAELPDLIEIPNHWFFLQLHATQYFFQRNLKVNLLLFGEILTERSSLGLAADYSSYFVRNFEATPLVHAKLLFEIGNAEIFVYWFNLSDEYYFYRARQLIPGIQFQYGVRWKFWD